MLICFEGMDGTGKSVVSKKVSSNLDFKYVEKPIDKLLYLDKGQSSNIVEKLYSEYSKKMQAMYYLMGFLSTLEDSKRNNIILDRGLLSTYYFSYDEETRYLFDSLIQNNGKPDLNIILFASIEERIKRIRDRNSLDIDLNKERIYNDGYNIIFDGIKQYDMNYVIINTNKLSVEEVCNLSELIIKYFIKYNISFSQYQSCFSIDDFFRQENMTEDELKSDISNYNNKKIKLQKRS